MYIERIVQLPSLSPRPKAGPYLEKHRSSLSSTASVAHLRGAAACRARNRHAATGASFLPAKEETRPLAKEKQRNKRLEKT